MSAVKIAVIGLGVLGAAAARSLALAGAEVTVYERTGPSSGTSRSSFGWINSHNKNPLSYHELNVAGIRAHQRLAAQPSNQLTWFHQTGNLEWAEDDAGAERLAKSADELSERGYDLRWITPEKARHIVPDLRLATTVREVAHYPSEGFVIPALLVSRLWGEARDHGARLQCPANVVGLTDGPNGVTLHLTDGEARADAAVIAAGLWSEPLTAAAGQRVPMCTTDVRGSAGVGYLGLTEPVTARLKCLLTTPRLNLRPNGNGSIIVQALDLDAAADPAVVPPPNGQLARELCARLREVLGGTDEARLQSIRVVRRSVPADGLTSAGFLHGSERVYSLATHSGLTLAPLLGELAAGEIMTGRPSHMLADFRPARFIKLSTNELAPLIPARFAGQQ